MTNDNESQERLAGRLVFSVGSGHVSMLKPVVDVLRNNAGVFGQESDIDDVVRMIDDEEAVDLSLDLLRTVFAADVGDLLLVQPILKEVINGEVMGAAYGMLLDVQFIPKVIDEDGKVLNSIGERLLPKKVKGLNFGLEKVEKQREIVGMLKTSLEVGGWWDDVKSSFLGRRVIRNLGGRDTLGVATITKTSNEGVVPSLISMEEILTSGRLDYLRAMEGDSNIVDLVIDKARLLRNNINDFGDD